MKIIFNSFFALCFSLSFCFAGTKDEFIQDLERSMGTIQKLREKILVFPTKEYYGKKVPGVFRLNKVLALLDKCEDNQFTHSSTLKKPNKDGSSDSPEDIGQLSFTFYCRTIPLLKNLFDEKSLDLDSLYATDLEDCIHAINVYPKYFTWVEEVLSQHLKIKSEGKEALKSAHRSPLSTYAVHIDERQILFNIRRILRPVLNKVNLLESCLERFQLPLPYKNELTQFIEETKGHAEFFLKMDPLSHPALKNRDNQDLGKFTYPYKSAFVNERINDILRTSQQVAYHPLNLKVGLLCLTIEQRELNQQLLDTLLEEKQTPIRLLFNPASKSQKEDPARKARKSIKRKPRAAMQKPSARILPTPASKPSSSQSSVESSDDLVSSDPTSFARELLEDIICNLPIPMKNEPSSYRDSRVEEVTYAPQLVESSSSSSFLSASSASSISSSSSSCDSTESQDKVDNVSFINKWLSEIIKASQSKDDTFFILLKAENLKSMLAKRTDLLTQIQEATASLAIRLQKLEEDSLIHPLFRRVPQELESDFLYFMDTPISYLKGLRFRFIDTLFQNLGVTVDKSRSGSRIHFSLRNKRDHYETSIHLHDKHNGELDGGRISSLRKFLIDCGFIYREIQSSPAKKPVHRIRK